MKHTPNVLLLLIIALAADSCGKKDASLLELVPASPIVNPDTRVLIKDNALIYAELAPDGIRGFNRTHCFTTTDGFQSFTIYPYAANNTSKYKVQGSRIVFWNPFTPTPFIYSTDFGKSWQTIQQPQIEGFPTAQGHSYGQVADVHFIDDHQLLLFATVSEYNSWYNQYNYYKTNIYKLDLTTGKGVLFSTIDDGLAAEVKFLDQNTGFIHLNKLLKEAYTYSTRNAYFAKTTDGGRTWSTPVRIQDGEPMTLAVGSDGYLVFYNSNGLKYASANGGTTWSQLPTSPRISNMVVFNANSLVAVSEGGFVKSTDGGTTWHFLAEKDKDRYRYGKISFRNEKEGIIYQDQSLYQTTDGGATWLPLLNPYPYIIN